MRILVVGAGAIGGYVGGRFLEAGRDVTLLVRARRAAELARTGLIIRSRFGNVDPIGVLSCKHNDLPGAIASFAPALGPHWVRPR